MKKISREKLIRTFIIILLAAAGYGIIIYYINLQVAAALFILQWGHNIEKHFNDKK